MSIDEAVQKGKDRYFGSRLGEHDERLEEHADQLKRLGGVQEAVEVPPELAEFVTDVRNQGASDELAAMAVFEKFGLGAFSDRQIVAALQPSPQEAEGDEPPAAEPGDESGSDEAPGE